MTRATGILAGGCVVVGLALNLAPRTYAGTYTAAGKTGDWHVSTTWSPSGVPDANDEARIIESGGTLSNVTIASGHPVSSARVVVGRYGNPSGENRLNINDDLTIDYHSGVPYDGRLILALSSGSGFGRGEVIQSGADTVVDVVDIISLSQGRDQAVGLYHLNGGELRIGESLNSTQGYGQLHINTVGNTSGSDPLVDSPILFGSAGSGDVTADNFRIGKDANGNFVQEKGTATVESHLAVGLDGHTGTYVLNGGTIDVIADGQNIPQGPVGGGLGKISLGVRGGSGSFHQLGSTVNIDNDLRLGVESGNSSSGIYYLDSGTLNVGVDVKQAGNPSLPKGEVANEVGYAELNIGTTGNPLRFGSGASGDITLDQLRVAYWNGNGNFVQNKGAVEIGSSIMVGGGGHTGTYDMNAGSLDVTTAGQPDASSAPGTGLGTLFVSGWGGTGTFNQNGAGTSVSVENELILGGGGASYTSNDGVYELHAGTLDVGGAITNPGGYSEMNITGGTLTVGTPGLHGGSTGDIHLDKLRVSFRDGDGDFVQDGGDVLVDSFVAVGAVRTTGTYTMYDGSLEVTKDGQGQPGQPVGSGTGTLGVGVNGATGTFTQYGGIVTVRGQLDLASNVNIKDTPSNGTYELRGGLLDLDGNPIEADSTAIANSQANFSFTGGMLRDVSVFDISTANHPRDFVNDGGTLQPGPLGAGGTMNIVGDYIENAGTLEIDLFGPTDYDSLDVDGAVQLGSTLAVNLGGGYSPSIDSSFLILDNDGSDLIDGTFSGLPQWFPLSADGETFYITYRGGDGNDVVLSRVVPEPVSLCIWALGALGLAGYTRRRRSRSGRRRAG